MYSLYRAWFGSEESYPRLMETLSPPDTVVRVGNDAEFHFVAHRSILAAHSGYLKALLATEAVVQDSAQTGTPVITSITVPSTIGGEAFAPLLNYMYTGRLEVTLDNIYTVLLATHLLHMPGALEQCRAALLRLRAPPVAVPSPMSSSPPATSQQPSSILRPVPNRLLGPAFCWPQYPPARHLDLPHLPHLQSLSVLPTPLIQKTTPSYATKEPSISPCSSSSRQRAASNSPELVVASSSTSPVLTSHDDPQSSHPTRNPSPCSDRAVSLSDGASSEQTRELHGGKRSKSGGSSTRPKHSSRSSRSVNVEARTLGSTSTASSSTLPGVVYDVACCDGPVRFHRVLNENYAPNSAANQASLVQIQQQTEPLNRVVTLPKQHCNGRSFEEEASSRENDENEQLSLGSSANNNSENRTYTCGYCRHTFKSQYCYRKHARRHLLPTESNDRQQATPPTPPPPPPPQPAEGKKREVRLLDLNVQYYPCKICGSKFPSYYFVHKHRKLCHANVEDPPNRSGIDESKEPQAQQQQQQQQAEQQLPGTSENVQQPT